MNLSKTFTAGVGYKLAIIKSLREFKNCI